MHELVSDTCRVVVERFWQRRPSSNGHVAYDPVVIVCVHLVGAGIEGLVLLTPERFAAVAHAFGAMAPGVASAAQELRDSPGVPPA